ncbi:MAG: hypothetical protein WAN35_13135 [Terracidiphilus sp.]
MIRFWSCLLCAFSAVSLAQTPKPAAPAPNTDVMVVAVSHDNSVLGGGIDSGRPYAGKKVSVEPLAWITPSGEWKKILCDYGRPTECKKFEREYLKKPHTYTVVSADGRGASVKTNEMSLDDECFGYGGDGTFSGNSISYATVAAESTDLFISGKSARRLAEPEAEPIRKAFAVAAGDKLASTKNMRVYSVQLEDRNLIVVQRAFQNFAEVPDIGPQEPTPFIFAIGSMNQGKFHLLFWKENTIDENEQILGLVHLKNGRDYLVNTVSDPETQFFRIYGIRNGKLTLVFSGAGGGC